MKTNPRKMQYRKMADKISIVEETIIVTDFKKDALHKSNTTEIEKIQKEIKSFHEFNLQIQLARIEKLVENNIFHTNPNRLVMKMRSL